MSTGTEIFDGGCTCRAIRYRMTGRPMFVHSCHCRWCQRETGTAFALNALIQSDRVELLSGKPELVDTPSNSGRGQKITRCPACRIAVWSIYGGAGDAIRFHSGRHARRLPNFRPISTSSRCRNSLGSFYRPIRPPQANTTTARSSGPKRVLARRRALFGS